MLAPIRQPWRDASDTDTGHLCIGSVDTRRGQASDGGHCCRSSCAGFGRREPKADKKKNDKKKKKTTDDEKKSTDPAKTNHARK